MTPDRRIRGLLREVNHCRRLWRAWNSHMLEKRPADRNHWAIRHMYLVDEIKDTIFFRCVVRLYALMENDNMKKKEKFTFGYWLGSLPSNPVVNGVRRKYEIIASSNNYKLLQKKRHNYLAHNALEPKDFSHSYGAVFQMSEAIEQLYDEIVAARLATKVSWIGPLDQRIHESNCEGGIEVNVSDFFDRLNK